MNFNLSPEDAEIFWRYAGLCLLGKNVYRKILLIVGTKTGTGKSVLAELLERLVGPENTTQLRTKHLSGRFEMDRFHGKTLLIGPDVPGDFLSQEGAEELKKLTGGDLITPEGKHTPGGRDRSFRGRFCVVITSNNRLTVPPGAEMDPWKSRLIILESLGKKPSKQIPEFAEMLIKQEGPGILNRAIRGLADLMRDCHEMGGDFPMTAEQKNRVDILLCSSDSVRIFVKAHIQKERGSTVTEGELESAYLEYCRRKGWHPQAKARHAFGRIFKDELFLAPSCSIPRGPKAKAHRGYRGAMLVGIETEEMGQLGRDSEIL